jgi:hypothetical protein
VFFPAIGWVIFEPTVSQAVLSRPSGEEVASNEMIETGRGRANQTLPEELGSERQLPQDGSSSRSASPQSFWTTGNIILFVAAQFTIGLIVILIWQFMRGFRLYAFMERVSIGVPETMAKGLRKMGITPPDFLLSWIYYLKLPPASRSYLEINNALERLGKKLSPQTTPSERVEMLIAAIPPTDAPARQLLREYHRSVYSAHPADVDLARQSAQEIRRLSWQQFIKNFIDRIKAIFKRGLQSAKDETTVLD